MTADIKNDDKHIKNILLYSPKNRSVWESDSKKGTPLDSLFKIWMSTHNSVYILYI
jgi:hypothetical protein